MSHRASRAAHFISAVYIGILVSVVGCVDAAPGGSGGADGGTDAATGLTTLAMPSVTLAPGEEKTMCVTLQLPNATAQMLRGIHVTLAAGSHHLIAYRTSAATPQPTPTACEPFEDITNGISPLIIAESSDSHVVYPAGVGLPIQANQMIKLEEHFINVTSEPIQSTGTVEFDLATPDPALVAADLLFWGPTNFQIAPQAMGSADFFHLVNADVKVFAVTTHEHHFGTLATITEATSAEDPGKELYRNTDWEHPPLGLFEPALQFDGTKGLRLHCEWSNTSNKVVDPGLSAATNEMCFFWAYYYPSQGFQRCSEDGCEAH